jgi:hypothetical protein
MGKKDEPKPEHKDRPIPIYTDAADNRIFKEPIALGWLVIAYNTKNEISALTFVPDPEHNLWP